MMVDLEALQAETSAAVWERGEAYAAEGRVTLILVREGRVAARVEGTETYHCRLEGARLEVMRCSCPAFADFPRPCKHLVATALTLARQGAGAPVAADRLRDWLMGLGKEALVARILDLAEADPDLEARLLLEAETATARPEELENILRKAITEATETHGFVDYRRLRDWASGVDAVIDRMEAAAVSGAAQASTVLGLVPDLIARLEAAVEQSEDDGLLSMLLDHAVALLAGAARTARPDPQAFGRTIAELDLGTDYAEIGPPEGALAEAMGEEGLAAYWSVIEAQWEKFAAIRPAERKQPGDAPAAYDGRLAKASETSRPRDAIRVYKTLAERAVEMTTKGGYNEAIGFIRRIRRVAQAAGGESEVRGWFTELRARYRRKRSFIAMLDAELETGE